MKMIVFWGMFLGFLFSFYFAKPMEDCKYGEEISTFNVLFERIIKAYKSCDCLTKESFLMSVQENCLKYFQYDMYPVFFENIFLDRHINSQIFCDSDYCDILMVCIDALDQILIELLSKDSIGKDLIFIVEQIDSKMKMILNSVIKGSVNEETFIDLCSVCGLLELISSRIESQYLKNYFKHVNFVFKNGVKHLNNKII